jgi:PAS domain S-box-containing protein
MSATALRTPRFAFTLSLVDGEGTVQFQSAAIEQLLGYKPEELAGSAWFSFLHSDDAEPVRSQFSDMVSQGSEHARWVLRFRSAAGGWRAVEVRARNLLMDPDVGGVLLSLREVPGRVGV